MPPTAGSRFTAQHLEAEARRSHDVRREEERLRWKHKSRVKKYLKKVSEVEVKVYCVDCALQAEADEAESELRQVRRWSLKAAVLQETLQPVDLHVGNALNRVCAWLSGTEPSFLHREDRETCGVLFLTCSFLIEKTKINRLKDNTCIYEVSSCFFSLITFYLSMIFMFLLPENNAL